ncbi:hypothetical protein QTN47_05755 [Danxiaibacter flavus]|uniref:Lipocalin-like domain-containing protein n=1 Tax=Danxiaibacter flavus TaxID=3049108 RepID=A0ABV3ZAV2_9BACT|nr:hypothetical protein QNM32_05755 [Chitinophagaceae bacterium DXS]
MNKALLFWGLICMGGTTISCKWFSHDKPDSKFLIGRWGFVTIADSSKVDTTKPSSGILSSIPIKDSVKTSLEFKTDSSYVIYSKEQPKKKGKYYVDSSAKTIYIQTDSIYKPLQIKEISDSTVELYLPEDSSSVHLKRE